MLYLIIFLILGTTAVISLKYKKISKNKWLYCLLCMIMILVSGLRFNTGNDYNSYYEIHYIINNTSIENLFQFVSTRGLEPVFVFFCKFFSNFEVFIFASAFISISLKSFFIFKKCKYPFICVFLYYSMYFLFLEMGIIRQSLAISVLLFAINYIKDKKFLKFFIIVLISSLIHSSSILFLPAYLCNHKYNYKNTTFLMIVLLIAPLILYITQLHQILYFLPINVISSRIDTYASVVSISSITILIKRIVIFLIYLYLYKNKNMNSIYLNLYFLGVIYTSILLPASTVFVNRGLIIFLVLQIFIIDDLIVLYYKNIKTISVNKLLIIIVSLMLIFPFINTYQDDDANVYFPYKSILQKNE